MSSRCSGNRRILGFLAIGALTLGAVRLTQPAGADHSGVWYVSVGGTGNCSQADPCGSIDVAYQHAGSGDTILMAAGTFGTQIVNYRAAANGFASNVVVQPETGTVSLAGASIHGPHLTIRGVSITGFTEIVSNSGGNANNGRIESVDSAGQIYVTGSDNVAVVNSWIHPGLNSVAIGISPYNTLTHVPTNTLIENNEIGPAWASSDWRALGLHNETIHVLGAANLTIRGNLIWEGGTSSSLQIDTSMGALTGIVVENNYIAGCGLRTPPSGAACAAYYSVGYSNYAGAVASEIIIRNNTIRGSVIDYGYNRNSSAGIASGNIIDGAVGCSGSSMYGNLLGAGSFQDCSRNTIGNALFTVPTFGGISWGSVNGLRELGYGVPLGAGFQTVPINQPPPSTVPPTTSTTSDSGIPVGQFGAAGPGPLYDQAGPDYKYGSIYSLGQRASLLNFKFYAKGGSASQNFIPAIYNVDSSGHPSTLVARGEEVTMAAGQAAGWVISALPASNLAPGHYLLSVISGPNSRGASLSYGVEANAGLWNANSFVQGPSATWGPINPENMRWSFAVGFR